MTDPRTQFLIQVLEKIGGPLTSAVAAGPAFENDTEGAQRLAELLNRSVQLGLSVAGQMNVSDEAKADGVHLALAAFASPLMAGQYLLSGRVPSESEIKRLTLALQAVLSFADNFTPAADSTDRLEKSGNDIVPTAGSDEPLVFTQMLTAFAPVLQAVNDYSFGKSENKLIQEIAGRLQDEASSLRDELFGRALPAAARPQVDLVMMRLLCNLYAACHSAEVRRLMELPETSRARAVISIEPVWAAFDKQAAMALVVARQLLPQAMGGSISGDVGTLSPRAGAEKSKAATLVRETPPAGEAGEPKSNPMAFFAPTPKKNSGTSA